MTIDTAVDDQRARDDGVVAAGPRQLAREERQFEGARHLEAIDVGFGQARLIELREQRVPRFVDDVGMP